MAGFSEGRTKPGGTGSLGTSGSLQFRQGGQFAGDNEITWDPTGDYLSVTGTISASVFLGDGSGLTGIGGGGTPGTPLNSIQFNDASDFGGDADLTWNKTSNSLAVGGALQVSGTTALQDIKLGFNENASTAANSYMLSMSSTDPGFPGQPMMYQITLGDNDDSNGMTSLTLGNAYVNTTMQGSASISGRLTIGKTPTETIFDSDGIGSTGLDCYLAGPTKIGGFLTSSGPHVMEGNSKTIYGGPLVANGLTTTISNPGTLGNLLLSASSQVVVSSSLSASLNISASAFYGDGSNLSGLGGQSFDTITTTTKTAVIDTTYYVTPNASNTLVTLPAVGTAGSIIKFIFDSSTAVDRYCDIVVTGADTMITPCSDTTKKIRAWKPSEIILVDNGSKWTSFQGSIWQLQPWFIGETEGTLGWGLYEVIAPGNIQGYGVKGILNGTPFGHRNSQGSTRTTVSSGDYLVTSSWGANGKPMWFGSIYDINVNYTGLFCETTANKLILTGTNKQFIAVALKTKSTFANPWGGYSRQYGVANQHSPYENSMILYSPNTDDLVMQISDDSGDASQQTIPNITNDTHYLLTWGWDESDNGWYSVTGSNPAAMTTATSATGVRDLWMPAGICSSFYSYSGMCSAPVLAAFHWHGRSRWSNDEATEFYSLRSGSDGKVLIDGCYNNG